MAGMRRIGKCARLGSEISEREHGPQSINRHKACRFVARGWRGLGFGRLRALMQAVLSAAVFGWRHAGTIVIAEIDRDRPSGATGNPVLGSTGCVG